MLGLSSGPARHMNSTNQSVLELFLQFCNLTALKESDPFKFLPSLLPSSDLELLNKSIRSEQGHTSVNTSFLKRNSMRINMSMLITVGPYWAQLLRRTEASALNRTWTSCTRAYTRQADGTGMGESHWA